MRIPESDYESLINFCGNFAKHFKKLNDGLYRSDDGKFAIDKTKNETSGVGFSRDVLRISPSMNTYHSGDFILFICVYTFSKQGFYSEIETDTEAYKLCQSRILHKEKFLNEFISFVTNNDRQKNMENILFRTNWEEETNYNPMLLLLTNRR